MSSSSSASHEDELIQIIDVCEYYVTRGSETAVQCAMVIGKDLKGNVVKHLMTDLVHEFFFAVSPQFMEDQAVQLMHRLNDHLIKKNERPWGCQVAGTPMCCCPDGQGKEPNTEYGFPTTACVTRRMTDEVAISGVELVDARVFTGYQPHPMRFAKFQVTRTYYASKETTKFLLTETKHDYLPPRFKQSYEMASSVKESFVNTTKMAGFDWLDTRTGKKATKPPADSVMVPLSKLVWDIETLKEDPHGMPDPLIHPVCMIAAKLATPTTAKILLFVLGEIPLDWSDVPEYLENTEFQEMERNNQVEIRYYMEELALLEDFHQTCVLDFDPDFIIGHNSNSFDTPYVTTRMRLLGSRQWNNWSRLGPMYPLMIKKDVDKKGQPICTIHCPGRVFLDTLRVLMGDISCNTWESFSLKNALIELGIKTQKIDVHHSKIWPLYHGGPKERGLLGFYNIIDVFGDDKVENAKMMVVSTAMNARLFRMFPQEDLDRGISYNIVRMLTDKTFGTYLKPTGYDKEMTHVYVTKERFDKIKRDAEELKKTRKKNKKKKKDEKPDDPTKLKPANPLVTVSDYELTLLEVGSIPGAHVEDPKVGYYPTPVCVLDYNSMYPSAMIAYNICHTTWVPNIEDLPALGLDPAKDVWILPNKAIFVKEHIKKGVIPQLVAELMAERAHIRTVLMPKVQKGSVEWCTYNGMQEGRKVAANSTYGQLANPMCGICLMCAGEGVTSSGQMNIKSVMNWVETAEDIQEYDAIVVYGDTDSAMVSFNTANMTLKEVTVEKKGKQVIVPLDNDTDKARAIFDIISDSVNFKSGIMVKPMKVGKDSLNLRGLFEGKKRYCILMISGVPGDPVKPELKIKGFQFIKRDTCQYTRDVGVTFLTQLVRDEMPRDQCYQYLAEKLSALVNGKVDREQLILSKGLSKPLATYGNDEHALAARQILKAGGTIDPAERIKYYHLDVGRAKATAGEKVMALELFDPEQHKIDYWDYAEKFVSAFKDIAVIVFGPENAKRVLDRGYYLRERQWMRQANGEPELPRYTPWDLIYVDGKAVDPKERRKQTKEENRKRQAEFMSNFLGRSEEKRQKAVTTIERKRPAAQRGKVSAVSVASFFSKRQKKDDGTGGPE